MRGLLGRGVTEGAGLVIGGLFVVAASFLGGTVDGDDLSAVSSGGTVPDLVIKSILNYCLMATMLYGMPHVQKLSKQTRDAMNDAQ